MLDVNLNCILCLCSSVVYILFSISEATVPYFDTKHSVQSYVEASALNGKSM